MPLHDGILLMLVAISSFFVAHAAEKGYFVSSHFRLDEDALLFAGLGRRTCLYPDYQSIIATGVCMQAVHSSPEAASYMYQVLHNYLPLPGSGDNSDNVTYSSAYSNSTLYLQTYSDTACSNYTGANFGPSTTFSTHSCQRPINDNNAAYYNVIYQYIRGNYPPKPQLPGPTVTLTGYLSQTACEVKYQVSAKVVLRDGACIVDPGQGAPLGNAEHRANSFVYSCLGSTGDGSCTVQYFTDHACRHLLIPSNESITTLPNLLTQNGGFPSSNNNPFAQCFAASYITPFFRF